MPVSGDQSAEVMTELLEGRQRYVNAWFGIRVLAKAAQLNLRRPHGRPLRRVASPSRDCGAPNRKLGGLAPVERILREQLCERLNVGAARDQPRTLRRAAAPSADGPDPAKVCDFLQPRD